MDVLARHLTGGFDSFMKTAFVERVREIDRQKKDRGELEGGADPQLERIDLPNMGPELLEGVHKVAAVLSDARREELKSSQFALPTAKAKKTGEGGDVQAGEKGKYPIPDVKHARNALARVSQFGNPATRDAVRRKVYAKYPELRASFEERHGESPTSKKNVTKQEQGGIGKAAEAGCATPGEKKRSGGKGRGMAVGAGKGPIGIPQGQKEAAPATIGLGFAKGPGIREDLEQVAAREQSLKKNASIARIALVLKRAG